MHETRFQSASVAVTDLKSMQSFSLKLKMVGYLNHDTGLRYQVEDYYFPRFVQLPKESGCLEREV